MPSPTIFVCLLLFSAASIDALIPVYTTAVLPLVDAYLESDRGTNNFGGLPAGFMGQDQYDAPYPYYDLLTMFNISGLPTNMLTATIIYQQQFVDPGEIDPITGAPMPFYTFNVYETATNWTEFGVTWNNSPYTLNTLWTNYQDGIVTAVQWNVLGAIETALASNITTLSFRVHSQYPMLYMWMREAYAPNRPMLQVQYTVS